MYITYQDGRAQAQEIAARALEGPHYHSRIVTGTVSISCTANVLATQSVTFAQEFTRTPNILFSLASVGNTSSVIKFADISASSNTGFTIRVSTDTTQTLVYTWYAIGDAS